MGRMSPVTLHLKLTALSTVNLHSFPPSHTNSPEVIVGAVVEPKVVATVALTIVPCIDRVTFVSAAFTGKML